MEFILKVKYGGLWEGCTYHGGSQVDISLREQDMVVYNVRYYISNICRIGLDDFVIHYLKRSRSGRSVKAYLMDDGQVVDVFNTSDPPTVYVSARAGPSSSHAGPSSLNAHVLDESQPTSGIYDEAGQNGASSQATYFDTSCDFYRELEEYGRVAASNEWIGNQYVGGSSYGTDPYCHASYEQADEIPPSHAADHEEGDDGGEGDGGGEGGDGGEGGEGGEDSSEDEDNDYVASDTTSDSSGPNNNVFIGSTQVKRKLFAEWTAWIHESGGMQKMLHMMYPTDYPEVLEEDNDGDDRANNWLVPVVPLRPRESAVYCDPFLDDEELGEDAMFENKKEILTAVGVWHLRQRKEFKVVKSDKHRMQMKCKVWDECPFKLTFTTRGRVWTVSKIRLQHACDEFELMNAHRRKVRTRTIATVFAERIRRDATIIKPRLIRNELQARFGIQASYDTCLRGRNRAIELVYGTYKDSYEDVPGYLHMLQLVNPGTVTGFQISPEGLFEYCFVALGPSIRAYQAGHLRPVFDVDATHLKGKNRGVMFAAIAKDGDEGLYPLAYGIGPVEENLSWVWFMQQLKRAYGELRGHLIVSDAHPSIAHAMEEVFPHTYHGLCYYHIAKNLRGHSRDAVKLFMRCAFAYETTVLEKYLFDLRGKSRSAFDRLMAIGPQKWSRCLCPARRFTHMTSNAAESFNNSIMFARRLPICACLDSVRMTIDEWFRERREKGRRQRESTTVEARRKLRQNQVYAETLRAHRVDNRGGFKVITSKRELIVDLRNHTCECQAWQLDCLPCGHAIAAIRENNQAIVDYVSPFYTRRTYIATYAEQIHAVPRKPQWRIPPSIAQIKVSPPAYRRQAGRPKERRHRAPGERVRRGRPRRRCDHCQQVGHEEEECPNI